MTSPLAEANPDSLTLLFEADPLVLSDAEVLRAILELRRRRSEFASAEAAKSLAPKRTRAIAPKLDTAQAILADAPISEVSFDDL